MKMRFAESPPATAVRPLVVGKLLSFWVYFQGGTLVALLVLGRMVLHLSQSVGGTGLVSSSVHQGSNKIRQEWWTSTTHVKENTTFVQKTVSFDAYQWHNTIISGILLSTIYTYSYSNTCIYIYIYTCIDWIYVCIPISITYNLSQIIIYIFWNTLHETLLSTRPLSKT